MGQNSTEVSYGFGQMGSVFANVAAAPVYPPKDHVIVAIQCLGVTAFTALETETLDSMGPQFPTHQDDELASAGGPDANYLGVVEATAASATSAGVVTIADAADNTRIKKGQYVLIGADDDDIDTGLNIDSGAGHVEPIYQGPNAQGLIVKSLTGGTYGTTLTITNANGSVVDLSSIDENNTLYFLDEFHGAGGTTVETVDFPAGITIYGRWTKVMTSTTTGVICYFGK
jgi:hypothetical protein